MIDPGAQPSTGGEAGFTVKVGEPVDGVTTVTVVGAVDLLTAPEVGGAVERAQQASPAVQVDLRRVEFLGSAGLSVLIDAARRASDGDGKLAILATNRAVVRAVEVTGLDAVLRMFDEADRAMEYLRS
jgi:anti-sigma B factor antagonist